MKFALVLLSAGLFSACGSLQTPDYQSSHFVMGRNPNSVVGNTSIVDDIHLHWPVDGHIRITQGFKVGAKHKRHQGIDIGGIKNEPIFAAQEGYVIYTGRAFHGYGKMIIIESKSKGFSTFYAHLNRIDVKQGRYVHVGDMIGEMGRTGHATGVHLHFELRLANLAVDPMPYLPSNASLTKN